MKTIRYTLILSLMFFLWSCTETPPKNDHKHIVELKQTNEKYRLYVNDKEFYVNGAGLEFGNIERLATNGGNAFRTWRTDNGKQTGKEVLDKAQQNGLMVLMGIEVGRERHGYDYNDTVWVKKQFEDIKKQVEQLKDHPAILGWAIGNELNLRATNPKVWDAVNDISKMIHEIDGNHPTTTTFAGFNTTDAYNYMTYCTDLDFVSIQMYGDIINLQKYIKESGYKGPYMVTEWGATGHWEVPQTAWNIAVEQTSSEKAKSVKERWEKAIAADSTNCLGSFIFLWGQKQERTPTWYGLFTERGNEIEAVDVMHKFWTGNEPNNHSPKIDSVLLNKTNRFASLYLKPDQKAVFSSQVTDAENDTLMMMIEVVPDLPEKYTDGGDKEHRPAAIQKIENVPYKNSFEFNTPADEGPYRIFIYVTDGNNHVATANIPFFVKS